MAIQTIWKASKSLPLLALFIGAVAHPLAAESAIYRCGPANSQRFSQIPCEENSEQVILEDHPMFNDAGGTDSDSADATQSGADPSDRRANSASNARAFITQLEKQRNEQLVEIDRSIEELQSRAETTDEGDEASADAEEAASLLTTMQNTRDSILSEYDAMISAARQRINKP